METRQKLNLVILVIGAGAASSLNCGSDTQESVRVVRDGSGGGSSAGLGGAGPTTGAGGSGTALGGSVGQGGAAGSNAAGAGGSGDTGAGGDVGTGAGGMATGTGGAATGAGGMPATGAGGMPAMGGGMPAGDGGMVTTGADGSTPPAGPINVLIWNTALTYGHQSRMTAIPLLQAQAAANNIVFDLKYAHTQSLSEGTTDATSDPSVFTDAGLDKYDVVFFLNTTGNTIDTDGQATVHRQALTDFIQKKGRGFVGTHSATDTYDSGWTWYTDFLGANFRTHANANTAGTARWFQGVTHPILTTAMVPNPWNRSEEWYAFTRDPQASAIPGITVLLTATDTSNQFGDRPITWVHDMPGNGRMFYTAFGHFVSAFQEKQVMDMIIAGIKWSAHRI